jgi:cell division protein ZapD
MRSCLRLEHLFLAVAEGLSGDSVWAARSALVGMLEIGDLLSRSDIKGELIKELERQLNTLGGLRDNPSVDQGALDQTIAELTPVLAELKSGGCQPGQRLRRDELVNQVRQRIAIPGGTCNFDVPAFHHWLHRDPTTRSAMLSVWMQDFRVIEGATRLVLRIVRGSATPRTITAAGGFYQEQLDASMPCHLIRVIVPTQTEAYPEISGGKHRFTIRFFRQADTSRRPAQVHEPIDFELHCCGM